MYSHYIGNTFMCMNIDAHDKLVVARSQPWMCIVIFQLVWGQYISVALCWHARLADESKDSLAFSSHPAA